MKGLLVMLMLCLGAMPLAAQPMIPALNWTERSDWVNVKTDITPAAVGDGVADDTAALQKALDGAKDGMTIYLPAGKYRITGTLAIKGPLLGVLVVGHGRDTRILWDGPAGGIMYEDNGLANSRHVGLIFDGQNKAAVGFYHKAEKRFETEVRHQHMAFLNCTDAGMLVQGAPATAETMTENCLFENCKRGIAFLSFNDYDFTIDGCEFRQCDIGVQCSHGNTYIRNCHFEGSRTVDITLGPEHGSSVRRCTSVGSKAFLNFANSVAPVTIQDCHVSGWTNPDGAVTISGAPVMMFDCVFTNPPGKTPPVRIRNGQRLIVSENVSPDTGGEVIQQAQAAIYVVPAGKRKGTITSAEQRFLKETVAIPTKIFDAKVDFGAKGDGRTDDTVAIQKTIDAARAQGKGAVAYLPTGVYMISATLRVTGAEYVIGGSGFRSGLLWKGPADGAIMEVQDPQRITIENLAVGNHDTSPTMSNAIDILQTGTGKPSFITYDNVNVFGMYQKKPFKQGLWLRGLGKDCTVLIPHVEGNIHLVDSARASVLIANSYEGSIVVEGKDQQRDGFLGILTHLGTICTHALYVKDNHSLTASDFYIEQADNAYSFQGAAGDPPGRITIQEPKLHLSPLKDGGANTAFDINGYSGQIVIGPIQFYIEPVRMALNQQGDRPLDIIFPAASFYNTGLEAKTGEAAHVNFLGSQLVGTPPPGAKVDDSTDPDILKKLALSLDDLRALGELDLRLNHPGALDTGRRMH